jgi:hypothetical protein
LSVAKRLNNLESHVCNLPKIDGSTRIYLEDAAESAVVERAQNIIGRGVTFADMTPDERAICEHAAQIAYIRTYDLFDSAVVQFLCHGDERKRTIFYMAFVGLMDEIERKFAEMDAEKHESKPEVSKGTDA